MSLLLIKPEFDIWEPGEHTGTLGKSIGFRWGTAALSIENTNLTSKLKSFLEKF